MTPTKAALAAVRSDMVKPLPNRDLLLAMFDYDPDAGTLTWKSLGPDHFADTKTSWKPESLARAHNAHYAGKLAFTAKNKGYHHGKITGVHYLAHRIIWKLVTGEDPVGIDHINGNKSDNRIANLRACTQAENSRNYAKNPGNSSKYRGVCWVKRDNAFAASISIGSGKKLSLGHHQNEIDAAKAYDRAAREHHGEFAVLNFPEGA